MELELELELETETAELKDLRTKLEKKEITRLDPKKYDFSNEKLKNLDFSGVTLNGISFYKAKLTDCNFENAIVEDCDFRYAKITDTTFKEAKFKLCDFHQTAFKGITIFQDSKFKLCSLSYISFDTYCITGNNLVSDNDAILIQENKEEYEKLLDTTLARMTCSDEEKAKRRKHALKIRYREAGRIYRQFSTLWEGKGNNKDGNWAYIQSKKMERKRLKYEEPRTLKNILSECGICISGAVFGYGIKLHRVLIAFAVVIAICTVLYGIMGENIDVHQSLKMGFGFIAGIGERSGLNEATYLISVIQTGIGMFLTGVFGFVMTNKIRKS